MFEEEYKKIIEQLKEKENYAVMSAICENVVNVLKENGVEVKGTVYRCGEVFSENGMIKENVQVCFKNLDFAEHDKKYVDEINVLKKQISELEAQIERDKELLEVKTAEVSISEDKILSCLCPYCGKIVAGEIPNGYKVNEEPLPFSSEYEECLEEELEDLRDRHQQDCITINQLQTTIDTLVDRYTKLREMRGL